MEINLIEKNIINNNINNNNYPQKNLNHIFNNCNNNLQHNVSSSKTTKISKKNYPNSNLLLIVTEENSK